jgi:hypothetical protein
MSGKKEGLVNDPLPNPSPLNGGGILLKALARRSGDASIGFPTGRCQ